MISRRRLLAGAAGVVAAPAVIGAAQPQVVVVGGGFGGATCARYLHAYDPCVEVTLVEPATTFVTCPMSNRVVASQLPEDAIAFGLDHVGDAHLAAPALGVDPVKREVVTRDDRVPYDRLVLAPGVDLVHDTIEGAPGDFLHAWKAGPETLALRDAIRGMRAGGVFAIAVPDNPYRCPARTVRARVARGGVLQDAQPAREDPHPRRQGPLHETGPVRRSLGRPVSRHDRVDSAPRERHGSGRTRRTVRHRLR